MTLNPSVWGPHYWFFLHTVAMSYPKRANTVTQKKYYELIQNFPLFIPVEANATYFSKLLDEYPVTPYLETRDSFIRWTHFIHNKINERLEKPTITLSKFYELYYEAYKPIDVKRQEYYKFRSRMIYIFMIALFVLAILYLYNF